MEFRMLGPLEVWDGNSEVFLSGPKPRALLALLLLHPNEVVAADRLIDELWGEETPERAAALRVNVSRLRKALPQDVLTTRSPGYVIQVGADELDLHRFERLVDEGRSLLARDLAGDASGRLRDALSLWRGPRSRSSPTRASLRPPSPGSRRSGWQRSSSGSTRTSSWDATTSWSQSSRHWSRSSRCESVCTGI